jgi:hypothetical protein
MNHNSVQTTELRMWVQHGGRSPHCEPTPSAPFAALKKIRTDAVRRGASLLIAPLLVRPISNSAAKMAGDAHDGAV